MKYFQCKEFLNNKFPIRNSYEIFIKKVPWKFTLNSVRSKSFTFQTESLLSANF